MYHASEAGTDIHDIAKEEGLPYTSTFSALNYLRKYLTGKAREQHRLSHRYKQAVRLIRQKKRTEPLQRTTTPQAQTPQGDNFTFLKASFDRFQDAVGTFIEVETNSRFTALRDENTVLTVDNKALRREVAKLTEEIERLKKEAEGPRTIDWVDALEGKLAKKE